jgi:hypothetical protein
MPPILKLGGDNSGGKNLLWVLNRKSTISQV